ncbi:hypothetical protein [Enterococcus diestrammenae]|uniref:Phage protein n=1 Tax=Enterococcus diestrammenae TaxID=1155073 RepID=A0ABV0F1R7_9ENTE|nr:hypothetical protein [Enterococcus diestrammenae]KAF1294806.1 hypothetical protein BAU18_03640 [Enterococcus diestrammenae]
MAKLADYGIHVSDLSNTRKVIIQGHEFPVTFTLETMEYIADIYGGDYSEFENDMNAMLKKADGNITSRNLSPSDLKIMRAMIYGMLRTGGLDEDPATIFKFLGMNGDVLSAYAACMEIFSAQTFQVEDLKKSTTPQDFQSPKKGNQKNKRKKKRK